MIQLLIWFQSEAFLEHTLPSSWRLPGRPFLSTSLKRLINQGLICELVTDDNIALGNKLGIEFMFLLKSVKFVSFLF